jgi:hypothetical protein
MEVEARTLEACGSVALAQATNARKTIIRTATLASLIHECRTTLATPERFTRIIERSRVYVLTNLPVEFRQRWKRHGRCEILATT